MDNLEDVDRRLRERLMRLPPAARAELLRVLTLPSFDRADAIGAYYNPATRQFAELLIDAETDPALRACLSGCCERWTARHDGLDQTV